MPVDRRVWWGGGAAAAMAALLVWNLASEGATEASRTGPARTSARARAEDTLGTPADVQLDRLAAVRPGPAGTRRNPFVFQSRAAPPPEPVDRPVSMAAPSVNALPPGPPAMAPIGLKFIGIVESGAGVKLAVLTDGRVVSHGQEGDIIDGRYRILKIGVESIEIAHADGRGRQTIRLTGQ